MDDKIEAAKPRKTRRPRIPRLKKWAYVVVEWIDAVTYREESHSDDDFDVARRRSIGHFVKRTKEALSVAMEDDRLHKDPDHDCQTVTTIPLGMIKEVTVLVPKEE